MDPLSCRQLSSPAQTASGTGQTPAPASCAGRQVEAREPQTPSLFRRFYNWATGSGSQPTQDGAVARQPQQPSLFQILRDLATGASSMPVEDPTDEDLLWFEQAMSRPPHDISRHLKPDSCLKDTLQHPERSLAFYQQEVTRRKEAEAAGKEYTFAPFLPTLDNMLLLVQNIIHGLQFAEPLTDEDRQAFRMLQGHILDLIKDKAPYKRTVHVALLMSCMLEIATVRYAFPALRAREPRLFAKDPASSGRLMTFEFTAQPTDGSARIIRRQTQDIALSEVLSCAFGGLNPGGPDEGLQLLYAQGEAARIAHWLENPALFLYPSFESLDPADFCRFGHLPVFPLGMMAAHALNADGTMMTPLRFLAHDETHTGNIDPLQLLAASEHPMVGMENRLHFRQQVFESVPACLGKEPLEPALSLVIFYLYHEASIQTAREQLNEDSILPVLEMVNRIRRVERLGYPARYRQIEDWHAILACLWVHRLARRWTQGDRSAPRDDRFFQPDLLRLGEHWNFLQRHRQGLRDYFFAQAQSGRNAFGGKTYCYEGRCPYDVTMTTSKILQEEYNTEAAGLVDNTDMRYFEGLLDPDERRRMAQAVHSDLPAGAF